MLEKHREKIVYLFFGVCTTLVNLVVFTVLCQIKMNVNTANVISIICAVLFAYITNAKYVFCGDINWNTFAKFISARATSAVVEIVGVYFLSIFLSAFIAKLITQVIVVVLNYIFSKLFVFSKKHG